MILHFTITLPNNGEDTGKEVPQFAGDLSMSLLVLIWQCQQVRGHSSSRGCIVCVYRVKVRIRADISFEITTMNDGTTAFRRLALLDSKSNANISESN